MRQVIIPQDIAEKIKELVNEKIKPLEEVINAASAKAKKQKRYSKKWYMYVMIIEQNKGAIRQYQEILNHL